MQIKDRTFLISGGSSGLGLATAALILNHGGRVSILDINPPPSSAHPSLADSKLTLYSKTDVSSTPSLQAALLATLRFCQQHQCPLSGVICSAGIGTAGLVLPKQAANATKETVQYYDMAAFDRTLAINLRGTVDLIRLAVPHMSLTQPWGPDDERGVIVVVSSVAAYEGQVGQLAYSASKGAVRSIVLPLARELGQKAGIRVVGIAPGVFETGMTKPEKDPARSDPQKEKSGKEKKGPTSSRAAVNPEMVQYPVRMGKSDEFARLVQQIIENPMINGDTIRLDGGVRMPTRL